MLCTNSSVCVRHTLLKTESLWLGGVLKSVRQRDIRQIKFKSEMCCEEKKIEGLGRVREVPLQML